MTEQTQHHRGYVPFLKLRPLRVQILTIFLGLTGVCVVTLTLFNFILGRSAALEAAREVMEVLVERVEMRQNSLYRETRAFARNASHVPALNSMVPRQISQTLQVLRGGLEDFPHIHGLYIGYPNGEFVYMARLDQDSPSRQALQAPEAARFALRIIAAPFTPGGPRTERWSFLGVGGTLLEVRPAVEASYDPRQRPWYALARQVGGTLVGGEPYRFASSGAMGVTFSVTLPTSPAVLGIDVTLSGLAAFMERERITPGSLLALFSPEGSLIVEAAPLAAGGPSSVAASPPLAALVSALGLSDWSQPAEGVVRLEGQDFLYHLTPLEEQGSLLVAAPIDELTSELVRINQISLGVALGVLLSSIPLVVLAASRVSRPLSRLTQEAEKIGQLNFNDPIPQNSRIREIYTLAKTLETTKTALATFGLYVPRDLVRQVMESGLPPERGGTRRVITVMFSDIQGFTTLSETIAPEVLMERLSHYMECFGSVIHQHGGSINKFIGDAVMATWNAPLEDSDHVARACTAVLAARTALDTYNAELVRQGLPPFLTRFGLHTGEAVVGHMGASDRMEYTALGDTVNTASRLEGHNKVEGTSILVSGAVAEAVAGRFAFRPVGDITLRGRSTTLPVFELMHALPS